MRGPLLYLHSSSCAALHIYSIHTIVLQYFLIFLMPQKLSDAIGRFPLRNVPALGTASKQDVHAAQYTSRQLSREEHWAGD